MKDDHSKAALESGDEHAQAEQTYLHRRKQGRREGGLQPFNE
jgi:hypothetical protein